MALFGRYLFNGRGVVTSDIPEFKDTLGRFKEDIASGKLKYIFNRCVCGSADERTISERDRLGLFYRYAVCMDCGLVRANPVMDPESTAYFYDNYYQGLYHALPGDAPSPEEEFRNSAEFSRKYYLPFLGLAPGLRVAMIGCGTGAVLYPFMEAGHECVGADFCSEKINYGRSMGIDLYAGHFKNLVGLGKKADVILLFDVVEHFIDLKEDFGDISAILEEGGSVVVGVPDLFKAHTYHGGDIIMDTLYCHNYWFSLESLNNTMSLLGYESTGKHAYIGTSNSLVAVYRHTGRAGRVSSPALAKKTLRYIAFTEYLYRARRLLLVDYLVGKLAAFVRERPALKRLAYRVLRKDQT